MRDLVRVAKRALQASPSELRARAEQAVFTKRNGWAARRGESLLTASDTWRSLGVDPPSLGAWWRDRNSPWLQAQDDLASRFAEVDSDASGLSEVLSRADQVCAGCVPLFSQPPVEIPGASWQTDPISSRKSPAAYYGDVPYLDVNQVGDHKYVWETSRFAWALWLGIAYRTRGDDRYLECFDTLASSWFRENPYPMGIHYCSALEVAFRAYAWTWSLALFADALPERPRLLGDLLSGIHVGLRHVEANLSTYFSPNTHILGEGFALWACGAALPEFSDAARWRDLGSEILRAEGAKQVFEDGTHRELSSGYHLYATDFQLHALWIARIMHQPIAGGIAEIGRRMADRLAEFCLPDGRLLQWNDCDGGRLLSIGSNPLDARPTLHLAGRLFPDFEVPEAAKVARDEAVLLAASPAEAAQKWVVAASLRRSEIPDSGLAVQKNQRGDWTLLRAGRFGYGDSPHSHDAPLGCLLVLGGEPILVDSGVGSYCEPKVREQFRNAATKNVLRVEGRGPSRPNPSDSFSWESTTDCNLLEAGRVGDAFVSFGEHEGFSEERSQVRVTRRVTLQDDGTTRIEDHWNASRPIRVEVGFSLAPEIDVEPDGLCLRLPSGRAVQVCAEFAGERVPLQLGSGPYSRNYGHIGETSVLSFVGESLQSGSLITTFRGSDDGEPGGTE